MKRERDWLDYAQLASGVGQNIQLGGIKGRLDNLQTIEAQKHRIEAQQINQAKELGRFRKYLFELEDDFEALQNMHTSRQPKERLWGILKIQRVLAYLGKWDSITYDDKDRHRALARRVDSTRAEAEKNLLPNDIADLNKAIEYRASLAELQEGIAYKQAVESYKNAVEAARPAKEAATAKLDELLNRDSPLPGKIAQNLNWKGPATGTGVSALIALIGLAFVKNPNGSIDPSMPGLIFLGFIGTFICGALWFAFWSASPSLETRQRVADVEKLKKEIAELDAGLPVLEEPELYLYAPSEADDKFSAADLTKTYDERVAFIVRVSGSNEIFEVEDD